VLAESEATVTGPLRRFAAQIAIVTAFFITNLFAQACGKNSPTGPSSKMTVVTASPGAGTTLGGTTVTITGTKFAAGATVTFGGVPATNVTVTSDTSLTANTPQHASGAVDIVVTVGSNVATLRNGYSYAAPDRQDNQAPVIVSLVEQGTRRNEPKMFADEDEVVNVTATVTDDTTPVDQLDYQWTAAAGSISGTGASVRWVAPHNTGSDDITLTVVETYQTTDDSGLPVTKKNTTTKTITVDVHDSAGEIADMANTFMLEFSKQSPSPSQIVRNFADDCSGKKAELSDVTNNQNRFKINGYNLDNAQVKVSFGGSCDYTEHGVRSGDGCAYVGATWNSLDKQSNQNVTASGTDQINAIYEGSRWWLCNSDFFTTGTARQSVPTIQGMVPGRTQ
jgi:hypothetical protein